MSHLSRRHRPALAKTKGDLRVIRPGEPDRIIDAYDATLRARTVVRQGHETNGRRPDD